jgi:hypothetical protein
MNCPRPALLTFFGAWLCACGPGAVGDSASHGESETEAGESETGAPDLPREPDCPARLGDLVSCECAFVDGCTIESADGKDCAVGCEQPPACESVTCLFDWAHGDPVCVELENPEALSCAFEALFSGLEVQVDLYLGNTYPFVSWDDRRSLIRLDSTQWLMVRDFSDFYDAGYGSSRWAARVIAVTDADLQACADADFAEAQFDCLFDLWWSAAQTCVDPLALSCAP